jgi:hypothetical protein
MRALRAPASGRPLVVVDAERARAPGRAGARSDRRRADAPGRQGDRVEPAACAARNRAAVFLDADVALGANAIGLLLAALEREPTAVLASPKTRCAPRPTLFERIMAVPYGVDFPNLSGQLYAAADGRSPAHMPEDLIEPERWLELEIGRERMVREPAATVTVRLPATLRDFYRQRRAHRDGQGAARADLSGPRRRR